MRKIIDRSVQPISLEPMFDTKGLIMTIHGEKPAGNAVFGVIYPPQVALVGFGKVVERPWVAEGKIVLRPIVTATLSADHRVTDGHRGGMFLAAIDRLLQDPGHL